MVTCEMRVQNLTATPILTHPLQGRSQDFGEGGAEYAREARAQILATPTYKMERLKFKLSQRTRSDSS